MRLADFEVNEGDILVLEEWDPKTKEYTGHKIKRTVTYVLKTKDITFWTDKEVKRYGLQILQLSE